MDNRTRGNESNQEPRSTATKARTEHSPTATSKLGSEERQQQRDKNKKIFKQRFNEDEIATVERDMIFCDQCHQEVKRDDMKRHLNVDCAELEKPHEQTADHTTKPLSIEDKLKNIHKIQKQQQAMEQRFQEQQSAIEKKLQKQQEESRRNLNKLENAIRNQLETHKQEQLNVMSDYNDKHNSQFWQFWMVAITIVVAVLLALVLGLSQKQTVTQQENANFSKQLNDLSYQITPSEQCGGPGWRRVAFINMTDRKQKCPQGLNKTDYSIRSCGRAHTGGSRCSSVTFPVGGRLYSQVCGRVTAYRWGYNYAFFGYYTKKQNIDGYYVDGLSLTHGSPPRAHIWSFASGQFKGTSGDRDPTFRCPCDPGNTYDSPPFVGNDYFCDSVAKVDNYEANKYRLFPGNALWDGENLLSTCYGLNNPPWFKKTLPVPTANDIELRMCFTEDTSLSNIGIELLEVYAH